MPTLATMSREESKINRCKRDLPPAHYMVKIRSYSMLVESGIYKYDSDLFEVGGHKWKLSLYPKGLEKSDKTGYISLYLAIEETDTYPQGWEVLVNFKLFVYDQIQDNYLTVQDAYGMVNRFCEMKKEWGFSNLISIETFNNPSHGYLVDDYCVFGAEVYAINLTHKCDSVSIVKEPVDDIFTWNLEKFSTLQNYYYESEVFTVGEGRWTLRVYPKGFTYDYSWLPVYLRLVDGKPIPTIFAHFKLRVLDILRDKRKEHSAERWFEAGGLRGGWGFEKFMQLKDLNEFIVSDTLTIEVQFLTLSAMKVLSSIQQGK